MVQGTNAKELKEWVLLCPRPILKQKQKPQQWWISLVVPLTSPGNGNVICGFPFKGSSSHCNWYISNKWLLRNSSLTVLICTQRASWGFLWAPCPLCSPSGCGVSPVAEVGASSEAWVGCCWAGRRSPEQADDRRPRAVLLWGNGSKMDRSAVSRWLCCFKPALQVWEEGEPAAYLRLEEWGRAESNGNDPLSMFALVAGRGRRDAVPKHTA